MNISWNYIIFSFAFPHSLALHIRISITDVSGVFWLLSRRHSPRSEWLSGLLHCHRKRSCLHRQELGSCTEVVLIKQVAIDSLFMLPIPMLLKHHRPSKQLHSCRGRVTSSSDPLWSGKSIWRPTDFRWQVDDSTPTSKIPRWNSIWTKRTLDDHVINGQQQSVLPKLQALLVSSTRICMPASLWTLSLCGSQSRFLDRDGRFLQTESLPVYQSQNYPTLFFHDSMCHFQHALFELTWADPAGFSKIASIGGGTSLPSFQASFIILCANMCQLFLTVA